MFILTCQLIQLACTVWVFWMANKQRKDLAHAQEGERSAVHIAAQYGAERDQLRNELQNVCNILAAASKAPEGAQLSLVLSLATAQCKVFQETAAEAQRVLDKAETTAYMFGRNWVLLADKPAGNPVVAMAQAHVGEIAKAMAKQQQPETLSGPGMFFAKKPGAKRVNITRRTVNGKRETVAQAKARIARELREGARRARR